MKDEFFSLPLFPQKAGGIVSGANGTCANGTCANVGCVNGACGIQPFASGNGYSATSTCSNCGTTCGSCNSSLCPRCGCAMTSN